MPQEIRRKRFVTIVNITSYSSLIFAPDVFKLLCIMELVVILIDLLRILLHVNAVPRTVPINVSIDCGYYMFPITKEIFPKIFPGFVPWQMYHFARQLVIP